METSFYKQFILDLQQRLTCVKEVRFVDQNLGQWGDDKWSVQVGFCGILVDFPTTAYSNIQGRDQLAQTDIKLTLFFNTASQSYNLAPGNVKDKALEYYEIESKIVQVLQGWSEDYFQPLVRTGAVSRNQNELGLRIRELMFSAQHEEYFDQETEKEAMLVFVGQIQQTNPAD